MIRTNVFSTLERNTSLTPIPQQGYASEDTENNQIRWSVGSLQVKQCTHTHILLSNVVAI